MRCIRLLRAMGWILLAGSVPTERGQSLQVVAPGASAARGAPAPAWPLRQVKFTDEKPVLGLSLSGSKLRSHCSPDGRRSSICLRILMAQRFQTPCRLSVYRPMAT